MSVFATPTAITAVVDIVLGDIRFTASDRADTVVEVRPVDPARSLDVEAADKVEVSCADGRLTVRHPKLRTGFARKFGAVRVDVALPTGSQVRADTAEGECVVTGAVDSCRLTTAIGDLRVEHAATVRLSTTGGRVTVDRVDGPATVKANGDIRLGRIDGDATVRNIGGETRIGAVGGALRADAATGGITIDTARGEVDATTATGDIRIGELGTGDVRLSAAIGSLDVGVPQGIAVRLDAHTTTGRVRHESALSDGTPGTGHPVTVRARCNGGDITVHRALAEQRG